jgi:hypothetical protein
MQRIPEGLESGNPSLRSGALHKGDRCGYQRSATLLNLNAHIGDDWTDRGLGKANVYWVLVLGRERSTTPSRQAKTQRQHHCLV